ncbi:RTA1-like protein [Cylindrobasidium torrendii FP15055 ss-10]|uniref:RTA1-like protein n=1 Tax=Cylindrobasidium torrendii FP15055 ss-10 TaxID=1314674 RepID=A0A0D7B206_9AGAR|nr:RTA1-like protein [Cylindrobasidium torrendii FP15055 ss-10]
MDTTTSSNVEGYSKFLGYAPSVPLAVVGLLLYIVAGAGLIFMTCKHGGRWMLAMPIAVCCYAVGIALRFAVRASPANLMIYVFCNFFTSLSPCGMIAAEYVLLGRLSQYLRSDDFLFISSRNITRVFVTSDVLTFLVQAGGGGIMVMESMRKIGEKLFLVGLILQLISFAIFTIMFLRMLLLIRSRRTAVWGQDRREDRMNDWRVLAAGMTISCIGVLVRSFYRVAEISGGYDSQLSHTEGYFWALDALPLFIAVVVYIPLWPGRFITDSPGFKGVEMKPGADSQQSILYTR